ncbi:G-protein [Aspergillus flavus AF70]|nr:G-protein [Aspergillus flavus AF70]
MEKAPLQIYFSALVFAPSISQIRNRFSHMPMQWMAKLPTIRSHWSSLQQTIECNPDSVLRIASSPDGSVLASTSGHKVRLWDPSSGQCLNTLEVLHGHTRAVNQVAFSSNDDMLASSSYDQTVRLWDPCIGNCLQILMGHTDCVRAVVFSPAPRFANILASVSDDRSIRIWDSTTAKCLQDIKTYDEEIRVLAFSCDGEILASAFGDKSNNVTNFRITEVQLWNPMTGQNLHRLQGPSDKLTAIAFSPNGKILASASWDDSVRLWDPLYGHCLAILWHPVPFYDVAFAPDAKTLAPSTSHDDSVWLWDPLTKQCLQKMEGHSSWVHSVAFSPSNYSEKLLASAALDDRVVLWSTSAEQGRLRTFEGHTSQVYSVAMLPDGEKMVSNDENTFYLWDLSTGQRLWSCGH